MKIEINATWQELSCIGAGVVFCIAAFGFGTYLGVDSLNRAAVGIDKNGVDAAAGLHMEAME